MKRAAVLAGAGLLAAAGVFTCAVHWWQAPPPGAPEPGEPWRNDLGMNFLPAGSNHILVAEFETQARDFRTFIDETRREWPQPEIALEDEYPAVNVTWDDAVAFCEWLTRRDRAARRIGRTQRYRLPASMEWTRAAAVESGSRYLWGNAWPPPPGAGNFAGEEALVDQSDPHARIAGYRDPFPQLAPVGQFPPNRHGLRDMAGNALEWCEDLTVNEGRGRIMRGGSWLNGDPESLEALHATEVPPRAGFEVTGFRTVLDVDPE